MVKSSLSERVWNWFVERAKIERAMGAHWLAGIGYASSVASGQSWKSKPLATVTRRTRAGNFEFWLQRIPGGAQTQFRYLLVKRNGD